MESRSARRSAGWPAGASDRVIIDVEIRCRPEDLIARCRGNTNPQIEIHDFEVYNDSTNLKFLKAIGQQLELDTSGVPFLMVGDQELVGYFNNEISGNQIKKMIATCQERHCDDPVAQIISQFFPQQLPPESRQVEPVSALNGVENQYMKLPLLGQIDIKNFSLPVLTIFIAAIDGFNPCAMWVLLFLISLLLSMPNKKRMYLLGSAFILASGIVYFLFLSAWLNLFLYIGFIFWIRILIALVAVSSGIYHLRNFYVNKPGCTVVVKEKREKIFSRLKAVTETQKFYLALGGVISVAIAVNLIELVCSAGLPAIYTKILTISNLPSWQYYLLICLYIIIFMLDDLLVFIIAMVTLQVTGISTKYTRYANFIGGIIILILGILLILKPEWLMFS